MCRLEAAEQADQQRGARWWWLLLFLFRAHARVGVIILQRIEVA
jgi:hypothetical protein